ncbi:hypothetical protein [Nonomuraea recticatena]|uniref:hypothetical protein n=1 Tax=Nonomuraea recticatena TaxID=46178 RepID=UPI00360A9F77
MARTESASAASRPDSATSRCSATCLLCWTAKPPAASASASMTASATEITRTLRLLRLTRATPASRKSRSAGVSVMFLRPVAAQRWAASSVLPWKRSLSLRPPEAQLVAAAAIRRCTARPSLSAWIQARSRGQAIGRAGRSSLTGSPPETR